MSGTATTLFLVFVVVCTITGFAVFSALGAAGGFAGGLFVGYKMLKGVQ